MRPGTAAKLSRELVDSVAMLVDGHIWCYIDEHNLFFRLKPGSIPQDFISSADADAVGFLALAGSESKSASALPVERGDTTTIGGVMIDADLLDAIEQPNGPLVWRAWRQWLVGRNATGEIAAAWKMPDGVGLLDVFMIEAGGHIWAASTKFFCRFTPPRSALKKIRQTMRKDQRISAHMVDIMKRGATGKPAPVTFLDTVVKLGESYVPREQFDSVIALSREKSLEWRWTGPLDPVVGFKGEEAVAAICPFAPGNAPVPMPEVN